MSVNFDKNNSELLSAWKEVLDDTSPTNWYVISFALGHFNHHIAKNYLLIITLV